MAGDKRNGIGGWLVVAGALGVAVITGIYASAPTLASAPLPSGASLSNAMAASVAAAGQLRLAGSIGLAADIALIGGCLLLALRSGEPPARQLFWVGLALATAVFLVVDGLASGTLPALAALGDAPAYTLGRGTYDTAFALGIGTFGAGFIAAGFGWPGPWRFPALGLGIVSIAVFGLHLAGITEPLLMGLCVGTAGLLGAGFGYRETRAA